PRQPGLISNVHPMPSPLPRTADREAELKRASVELLCNVALEDTEVSRGGQCHEEADARASATTGHYLRAAVDLHSGRTESGKPVTAVQSGRLRSRVGVCGGGNDR